MGGGRPGLAFDIAALPYTLFFHSQRSAFRSIFNALGGRLGLPRAARVLDIGCGTGAHATVLDDRGFTVSAVEPSPLMRAVARRRFAGSGIALSDGNPLDGLSFPDGTFDLVFAAHVLHGMPAADRAVFCRETLRVSRGLVLFHDFPPRLMRHGAPLLRALETLEGSDYRRFIRTAAAEMRRMFASVDVIAVDAGCAWYVCRGSTGSGAAR